MSGEVIKRLDKWAAAAPGRRWSMRSRDGAYSCELVSGHKRSVHFAAAAAAEARQQAAISLATENADSSPRAPKVVSPRKKRIKPRKSARASPVYGASDMRERWRAMLARCENPNKRGYANYGGRGITVCPEWHTFGGFVASMGARPSSDHSLDRIDNNGNYEPGNCRWATRFEQQRNKRNSFRVMFQGRLMTAAEIAEATGVGYVLIYSRLKRGMPIEQVISLPSKYRGPLSSEEITGLRSAMAEGEGARVVADRYRIDRVTVYRILRKARQGSAA